MKKILATILAVAMVLSLMPMAFSAPDGPNTGVRIQYKSLNGDILTVAVQVYMPTGDGITSLATALSYDNTKLELMHKTNDSTIYNGTGVQQLKDVSAISHDASYVATISIPQGVDTMGHLFGDSVRYTASANSGRSVLVNNFLLDYTTPAITAKVWTDAFTLRFKVKSGAEVLDGDISFATSATDSTAITALDLGTSDAVVFNAEGGDVYYINNLSGTTEGTLMSVSGTGNSNLQAPDYVLGDVNGSGKVNATDVTLIRRHLVNPSTNPLMHPEAADVNSSGKINATDVTLIRRHLVNPTTNPLG